MHLFNLPFPIRDYINDCKLILDSCGRVVIGLIDIAKSKRLFDATSTCIRIQQTIYQGLSCNVPFITHELWKKMAEKFDGLAGITEQLHRNPKFSKELVKYLEKSMPVWDHHMRDKILEAFKSHPVMRMEVRSRGFDSEENVESGEWVEEGGEAVLYVTIEKENNCSNRVMVQKHTKIKDVTWWILVADNRNNLLALRKASMLSATDSGKSMMIWMRRFWLWTAGAMFASIDGSMRWQSQMVTGVVLPAMTALASASSVRNWSFRTPSS